MKTLWNYFWRVAFLLFIVIITGSGIVGIIMPYRCIETTEGRISNEEYQGLPTQAKLLALGWSLFQIILGCFFLYKLPIKKDKIVGIIFIALFVLFYCLVVAPSVK